MRIGRWVAAPCIVSLLAAAAVVGTATSAAAIPSDCSISYGSQPAPWGGTQPTVSSFCASGTGQHKIHMTQRHFDPTAGPIAVEGPWANVGSYSTTTYPPHTITNVWIELR